MGMMTVRIFPYVTCVSPNWCCVYLKWQSGRLTRPQATWLVRESLHYHFSAHWHTARAQEKDGPTAVCFLPVASEVMLRPERAREWQSALPAADPPWVDRRPSPWAREVVKNTLSSADFCLH